MSVKVEFKRVQTDEEVENIDIKDGQLIYTGTGKTYMDYGTERIPTGSGGSSVEVDTEMSDTSENAVQNKVIKEYVDNQISIGSTEPTDDENKIWIDTGEIGSAVSEITNSYSTSTGIGYSANYVNNLLEVETGTITITNTSQVSGTLNYVKYGRLVQILFDLKIISGTSSTWATINIASLPDNLKPLFYTVTEVTKDNLKGSNYNIVGIYVSATSQTLGFSDRGRGNLSTDNNAYVGTITYITAE